MVHKVMTYMSKNISLVIIDNKTLDFIHDIKIENMMFAPFSPGNLLFSKKCLSFYCTAINHLVMKKWR